MNKHKRQTVIRQLRAGEAVPAGEPKRYRAGAGYIRLRWKVGVCEYVEVYEHRIVAGLCAADVHHRNGQKDDNQPDNLQPVTSLEHGAEHSRVDFAEAARLYAEGWKLTDLAQRYGVGHVSLMRFLKRRGVRMRTRSEAWRLRRSA